MTYNKKTVIVTGGANGIGRCIAEYYGSEGGLVVIADNDKDSGSKTLNLMKSSGSEAFFIHTDLTNPADIESLFEKLVKHYGPVDILINNAGISNFKSPFDISVEEWDRVVNTNLRGAFLCSREAAKTMKEQGGGSIVNISSTRALMSEPGSEAYAASKGGLVSLTHALAASFAPYNIQVNCISPGWVQTGDYDKLTESDHKQHLSGRVGRPDDIASACLYLTREDNRFINGANIVIDGGMTRKMIYEE